MPAILERCVSKVKARGKVKNAWAVCRASLGSDAEIKARAKKREWPPAKGKRYVE